MASKRTSSRTSRAGEHGSRAGGGSAGSRETRWSRSAFLALIGVAIVGAVLAVAAFALSPASRRAAGEPVPVSRVDTQDVHALAFMGTAERLLLGHHGGVLESTDGGRTWVPWGSGSDAMALGVAAERPVVVAGHDVLAVGRPDGSWENIANDLPHNDIHGFARDPHDPDRMWAYLATGGLYESRDGGASWEEVFAGHTLALLSVARGDSTLLIAVDPELAAIVASDDGGRSWQAVGPPPDTPAYAMAAAREGETLLFSGSRGLFRSDDGGATFVPLLEVGEPILAVAAAPDGTIVVLASRDRYIYRSEDGGRSWPAPPPGG